tara:strand:- start:2725 stop:3969 length:1245 start_codon:yes stop_codon:yes gene_type:complete
MSETNNMPKKTVLFFVRRFPILSQTFVINQINDLINAGHDVKILAVYPGDMSLGSMQSLSQHELLARTSFLLPTDRKYSGAVQKAKVILKGALCALFSPRKLPLMSLGFYLISKRKLTSATEIFDIIASAKHTIEADTIVAHFGNAGVLASHLIASKLITGNLLTVFHGYEISEYDQLALWGKHYKKLSNTPGTLLPISELWANRLINLGVPREKITVVHMGVDVERFKFDDRPLNDPIRILSVARATEKKGLTYALEAIEKCGIDVRYDIIGGGELEVQLVAQVADYQSKDNITIHGPKPSEFVAESLKKADIFLLPSVIDQHGDMEGIPVSLMEAMACGVIVLSTFHSGIPELVEHEKTGFLVPEKNAEAIAKMIKEIAQRKDLPRIRAQALKHVTEQFNSETLLNDLNKLI